MKVRPLPRSLIAVTMLVAAAVTSGGSSALSDDQWYDVTDDAVQTFYQDYTPPHTDRLGSLLHSHDPDSSIFPIGIYYPWPCTTSKTFDWSAYAPSPADYPHWDGETYALWVRFAGDWPLGEGGDLYAKTVTGTSATVDMLPANVDLSYIVYFRDEDNNLAWAYAEDFTIACPADDVDDPNAIETLAQAAFNVAIAGSGLGHPYVLSELKRQAPSAQDFTLVPTTSLLVAGLPTQPCCDPAEDSECEQGDPRDCCYKPTVREPYFNEALFDRYSDRPQENDIFGFYFDDEPMRRAYSIYNLCPNRDEHIRNILGDLTAKYEGHENLTEHAMFFTEWADEADVWWGDFMGVGDAASHDNYPYPSYGSLDSLQGIAESVSSQTVIASEEHRPSWFTAEAFNWYHLHFPTPVEMRATAYTAIVHGATGIWHFLWDSWGTREGAGAALVGIRPRVPRWYPESGVDPETGEPYGDTSSRRTAAAEALWYSLAGGEGKMGLNAELTTLAPVILSPTSNEEYHVYIDQEPGENGYSPIRTMLKLKDDAYYLIAVNMDEAPVDTRFEFAGHGIADPQVMFEPGEVAEAEGNVLLDHFEPFAAHVYRFYLDTDLDGVGDVQEVPQGMNPYDPDSDDDEVSDGPTDPDGDGPIEAGSDNCPLVHNPDQMNTALGPIDNGPDLPNDDITNPYEDMVGDACDDDADNDGLPDGQEYEDACPYRSMRDSDGDWLVDGMEVLLHSDPCNPDDRPSTYSGVDKDRDTLPDWLDAVVCPSDVDWDGLTGDEDSDCDGDGLDDGAEMRGWGTDPYSRDSDGDGCEDDKEVVDVDGTRQANILDTLWVTKAALGIIACHGVLDLNGNGNCDIYDALMAAKNSTLLEPHDPCP